MSSSKYDNYFTKIILPSNLNQWKCKLCTYTTKQVQHTSTTSRENHLQNKHKKQYDELMTKTKSVKEVRKRTNPEAPVIVPPKQLKVNDGLFLSTTDTKSRQNDNLIMEMIATQNLPFSFVDSAGFRRLMKQLDPRYDLRSRNYFSQEKLPENYEKVKQKIKESISKLESYSIGIDEWADEGNSHVLLGVTLHFLEDFEPRHYILAAQPIKGGKDAENLSKILNEVFIEFDIAKDKISYVLRDGASVVVKLAKINGLESEHCLAHATELVIGDGKKVVPGLETAISKIKKLIKKLKKSGKLKQTFHEHQKLEALPEKNLEAGIEVRWNSLYLMLKSCLNNKKPVQTLCIEEELEQCALNGEEWKLVEDFVVTLKIFYSATLFLQRRDTTISYVIPIIKVILHDLEEKQSLEFGNATFIEALLNSLDARFGISLTKKNLIIATLLDPRFKSDFLDKEMLEVYKKWIVEEIVDKKKKGEVAEAQVAEVQSMERSDIFTSFLNINKAASEIETPEKLEVKHLVEAELIGYLYEPTISRDLTAGSYWKINSGRFPYLSKLYCKHATAPATSAEAERLFSIAGLVLDVMRKRLHDETIKKLLFLNCNLKLLNYDY